MLTIVAFVVALAVLIAVHEYGHYRVAVACGVQVLRFSVGFGKTLWRWQPKGSPTEFVIAMFPLGGYVRMLDEREAPVAPEQRHLAFNNRPLAARAAIVAAGPLINLLLAVVLYTLVNWIGMQQASAVLASPVPGSIAAQAGIVGGERVLQVAAGSQQPQAVASFDDLRWQLAQAALHGDDLRLVLGAPVGPGTRDVTLHFGEQSSGDMNAELFRRIGIVGPMTPP
ncbi:MAG: RIP metalloprotease RseP, partial [Burkholderiaceae bacterium]